jgi:hypothetical protein
MIEDPSLVGMFESSSLGDPLTRRRVGRGTEKARLRGNRQAGANQVEASPEPSQVPGVGRHLALGPPAAYFITVEQLDILLPPRMLCGHRFGGTLGTHRICRNPEIALLFYLKS